MTEEEKYYEEEEVLEEMFEELDDEVAEMEIAFEKELNDMEVDEIYAMECAAFKNLLVSENMEIDPTTTY